MSLINNGIAIFIFWHTGQVITMAAPNINYGLKEFAIIC